MNIWNNQNEELHTFNQRKALIASRIKEERERRWKNQTGLGVALGALYDIKPVDQSTISKWESGDRLPPLDQLIDLSKVFHCDIAYLLGESEDRHVGNTDVVKYTGLTEEATERLHNFATANKTSRLIGPIFSYILTKFDFNKIEAELDNLIKTLEWFVIHVSDMKYNNDQHSKELYEGEPQLIDGGGVRLATRDAKNFLVNQIIEEFRKVWTDAILETALREAYKYVNDIIAKNRPGATNTETANDQN